MTRRKNQASRFTLRIAPDALRDVKHAAAIAGRTVGEFVANAALEAARKTIEEAGPIRPTTEDQERFTQLLLNPPESSDALQRARDAHDRLVRPSR